MEPYQAGDGEWAVQLRHRLSVSEEAYGLRSRLVAGSLEELTTLMVAEDLKHKLYRQDRVAPAWSHRNTS